MVSFERGVGLFFFKICFALGNEDDGEEGKFSITYEEYINTARAITFRMRREDANDGKGKLDSVVIVSFTCELLCYNRTPLFLHRKGHYAFCKHS